MEMWFEIPALTTAMSLLGSALGMTSVGAMQGLLVNSATSDLLATVTLLFTLLNVPIPGGVFLHLRTLITAATKLLGLKDSTQDLVSNPNPILSSSRNYDFIIVGAGSAGSVLANRLSAIESFKVLLLDAGGDPLILNKIPALAVFNLHKPHTDWMYSLVPQNNSCFGLTNNTMPFARGKSLGGSSNLNLMLYMRGNPKDFDNWANLTEDHQWSYNNCLPYFKKSENYNGNFLPVNTHYHGTNGLLKVESESFRPMTDVWLNAGIEMGLPSHDPNTRQTSSFYPPDVTYDRGSRMGTYDAFLAPVLSRSNLKIIRFAKVTKINLDSEKRATGVTYTRNGRQLTVTATKEVLLSAGSINSPQLLMLSGIGPSKHLRSVGIPVKVNLPGVGQNLEDHIATVIGPFIINTTDSVILNRDFTTADATSYALNGTGRFSWNAVSGMAHFNTSTADPTWPNIAVFYEAFGIYESFVDDISELFGLKRSSLAAYVEGYEQKDANFVFMNLGLPASTGTVKLRTKSPNDPPLIDPNYYSEPSDIAAMIEGYRFLVRTFEETDTFQAHNATLIRRNFPGCESHEFGTDEYIECYIKHFTSTTWHPSSTCKMGRASDRKAVVDSNLKVRNVIGLRVVDASVMPRITNANLNAPTIMIAEKAADLILADWK